MWVHLLQLRPDALPLFWGEECSGIYRNVCLHHDLGCLGAAVHVRAIERQLQILKEMLAAADGELSVNSLLTRKLADLVRQLDPTRPVTADCNEPDPGNHLFRSGYFGIIDLAGFPKDIYYMYQSVWHSDLQVLHLYPHWNWQEGQEVDLWAYYNRADEVELYVNGRSQGVRRKSSPTEYHVQWRVRFEPGVVCAVARREGREVARQEIHTAGTPAAVRLTPDRTELTADGRDLSFITVEVTDADGNLCPWAEDDIRFTVTGGGFIAGVDNGSPTSLERFKADHRRAFYGKCLLVVQSNGKSAPIRVKAEADGLAAAEYEVGIELQATSYE